MNYAPYSRFRKSWKCELATRLESRTTLGMSKRHDLQCLPRRMTGEDPRWRRKDADALPEMTGIHSCRSTRHSRLRGNIHSLTTVAAWQRESKKNPFPTDSVETRSFPQPHANRPGTSLARCLRVRRPWLHRSGGAAPVAEPP